ncbi:MAG TPA: hypothetical protein VGE15_03220, partial [Sphingobacteriaceae bacterium]
MNSSGGHHPSLFNLVSAHYLVSAACFLVLTVLLLFSADAFAGHYFQPRLLALTHMAALGWGSLMVFGACYQLLPVVLETGLYSFRLGWYSLVTFVPGLVLLVLSFWTFEPGPLMQAGSLLVLAGILLFTLNAVLTARKNARKTTIHEEFMITSCFWLAGTATLGVLLVFNFRYAFLPKNHLQFLRLHAHMGVAGWFLLMVIGVSSKLIPMFLLSKVQKPVLLSWSCYLINGALLAFLVDTWLFGLNIRSVLIAAAGMAGILTYLTFLYQCLRSRVKKALDLPMKNTILSVVLLMAAMVVLPGILMEHLEGGPLAARLSTLYGTLLLMGWISGLILGKTFKTLPFIIWVKHYEGLAGKVKTPLPADLYKKWLLKLQTICFLLFAATFFAGVLSGGSVLIRA